MSYEYRRDSQKQIYDIRRVQAKIGQPIERSQVFGLRLKAARQRMGLPQDKFGVLLGLDEHTASARISRYENGIHEPPLRTAQLIATTLNVPLCYMYCEDNRLAELILISNKFSEDQWGALDAFIKSISDQ